MTPVRKTDELVVHDDIGRYYTVIEITDFTHKKERGRSSPSEAQAKTYQLRDGSSCNLQQDGTFLIVETGAVLRLCE
jgi:hypothetical protein